MKEPNTPVDPRLVSQTRLCFKNVPSHLSSKDLTCFIKRHPSLQSQPLHITDCHVLKRDNAKPGKKHVKFNPPTLAFVGFSTPEQAQWVRSVLNQAYCQTHKLVVEAALLKTSDKKESDKGSATNKEDAIDEPKKATTQTNAASLTTKRPFWSNDDDGVAVNQSAPLDEGNGQQGNENNEDNDESSHRDESDDDSQDDAANPKLVNNSLSDFDFLRSKQVAVNDLEETAAPNMDSNVADDNASNSIHSNSNLNDDDMSRSSESELNGTTNNENSTTQTHHASTASSDEDNNNNNNTHPQDSGSSQLDPCRIFIRNLPYDTAEEDLMEYLVSYGPVHECHIPVDNLKESKGYAFCTFEDAAKAQQAIQDLDGRDFQGRILTVCQARRPQGSDSGSKLVPPAHLKTYKEKQEWIKQQEAMTKTQGWSASFVRGDAVVDNLAARLGLRKGDLLSVKDQLSAGDAAVRLALGETAIIEENRVYFKQHGIDMEALVSGDSPADKSMARSKTAILVKNLPHDTTVDELTKVFGDTATRILLPPSRTIAVVEYAHANDAKPMFRRLAYKRFKTVPLYLEWAPMVALTSDDANKAVSGKGDERADGTNTEVNNISISSTKDKAAAADDDDGNNIGEHRGNDAEEEMAPIGPVATLHVKNLNFVTTEDDLIQFFRKITPEVRAVRIPKKTAAAGKRGTDQGLREISMGYGFVEFSSQSAAQAARKEAHGTILSGHKLDVQLSLSQVAGNATSRGMYTSSTAQMTGEKKSTKLIVRNVPFQASRSEILKLFGSFGQLKKVRLPKKFDGGHRGFAFVEFVTHAEAAAAMQALSRTHLYGRHLVLEWASSDEEVNDIDHLREKAMKDVGQRQTKKMRVEW
jgi:multiple RNA-binding domain-containing protein 1